MTYLEVMNILWNLYDAAIESNAFEGDEDKVKCRDMLTNFGPHHRDLIVEYHEDSLEISRTEDLKSLNNAAEWAIELQRVLTAMDEPGFWPTHVVPTA